MATPHRPRPGKQPRSSPRRAITRGVLVAALLCQIAGCRADGPPGTLQLSWTFLDGRRCADSAVETMLIRALDPVEVLTAVRCEVGEGNRSVQVTVDSGVRSVQALGMSAENTNLYRLDFTVDIPAGASVSKRVALPFVGGSP